MVQIVSAKRANGGFDHIQNLAFGDHGKSWFDLLLHIAISILQRDDGGQRVIKWLCATSEFEAAQCMAG